MLSRLGQLKTYIYAEIISHLELVRIKKENIRTYFSSPYRIFLIVIYTILFLPHVFVLVKDLGLISAFETDPGSIIVSIIGLFQNPYNMNKNFHSWVYGWTYFSINFLLLIPIYLVKALKLVNDDYFFFVAIRSILFVIGLSSVLAFFDIAKRALKHGFLAFTAAMLFIASPVTSKFFYFLHPETTGLLFLFLGISCLLNYNDSQAKDARWYAFGLLSLVLSALSKHVFLFTAIPVLFLFVYLYCNHHEKSILSFLRSKQFIKVLFVTTLFSLFIFFIINPFAFFQPKIFLDGQIYLFSAHTQDNITRSEALKLWLEIIKEVPAVFISIILAPLALFGLAFGAHDQKIERVLYAANIISAIFFVGFISVTSLHIINNTYFAPVYPFFILNLLSIPLYVFRRSKVGFIKFSVILSLIYLLFFLLVDSFSLSIPLGYTRLTYKDSITYETYSYIEKNIPNGSKITHDHLVPISSEKAVIGCQYWQGCGTDYIEEFNPDYVIFSENWLFNGERLPEALRLEKYVSDHHFILVDTIRHEGADFTISVWKKPDP